jgi:hypothetical protein
MFRNLDTLSCVGKCNWNEPQTFPNENYFKNWCSKMVQIEPQYIIRKVLKHGYSKTIHIFKLKLWIKVVAKRRLKSQSGSLTFDH